VRWVPALTGGPVGGGPGQDPRRPGETIVAVVSEGRQAEKARATRPESASEFDRPGQVPGQQAALFPCPPAPGPRQSAAESPPFRRRAVP
jgi:hypothetical protein